MNNEFILRKPKVVFDIECNPNISHVGFKSLENGKVIQIETPMGEDESLSTEDITKLRKIMTSYTVIGFNSSLILRSETAIICAGSKIIL